MEYLSADKILVIDLGTTEVMEEELSEDLVAEKIGGAGITKHLYTQYEAEEPIVIGTGLLTGSMYPASAAGVITAKSPISGKVSHCPVTLKVAIELKYAGFDYIVIKGSASNPVFLWIHDGIADISDAADVWGKDVWETTDTWRKSLGDDLIQTMLIGKAGETGSDFAQVCLNYWASADRFGFGKLFGQKNLKGLALRGMGLLEVAEPEDFVDRAYEILDDVKAGAWKGQKGIGDMLAAMGEQEAQNWLDPLVHRHSACYFTPYATNTFVYLDEDPQRVEETKTAEPGVLVTDLFGLLGFKQLGLSAKDACSLIRICAKFGIDAAAVAELCRQKGTSDPAQIQDSLAQLSGEVTLAGDGTFSPWCPQRPLFADFGLPADDAQTAKWWERRQAVAYIFGIHPMFAVMSPELTEENMLELASIGTELELTQDILDAVIEDLCE